MVMSGVQRKIEDKSGASLSVALLFFLVCAIVGSILIAAASVAMGRMKNIDQGEQDRYAIDSAMNLLAAKMEGGEVYYEAAMTSPIYVQRDDAFQSEAFSNSSIGSWRLSDLYKINKGSGAAADEKSVLNGLSSTSFTNGDFRGFRDNLSAGIFQKESVNAKILGSWLVSTLPTSDSDKEVLAYGTPDTKWNDLLRDDYMLITDDGSNAKPLTLSVGSANHQTKVNVLFCMDAQFNITVVIYPYVEPKNGESRTNVNDPKYATKYRIVMIPTKETSVDFDPGITEEEEVETKTITNADGTTSEETIIHTKTYVQHSMKVKVAWGDAVKTSVLPPSSSGNNSTESIQYPNFFPDRFKDVLPVI